jgi:transcriptional regulator with XRE-family HTH domain
MIYNRVREYQLKYMAHHQTRLTIADLMKIAGVSRPKMLRILHNRTVYYDMTDMEKLCRYLGIPIDKLFYMDDADPDQVLKSRPTTMRDYTRDDADDE